MHPVESTHSFDEVLDWFKKMILNLSIQFHHVIVR